MNHDDLEDTDSSIKRKIPWVFLLKIHFYLVPACLAAMCGIPIPPGFEFAGALVFEVVHEIFGDGDA